MDFLLDGNSTYSISSDRFIYWAAIRKNQIYSLIKMGKSGGCLKMFPEFAADSIFYVTKYECKSYIVQERVE
jgi:hypothetical protein